MTSRVIDGVVYEFEAGTPQETIDAFVLRRQNMAKGTEPAPATPAASPTPPAKPTIAPTTAPKKPPIEPFAPGLMGQAAQGLSFGFSDEAIAAMRAAAGDRTYPEYVAAEREGLRQFREDRPVASTAAELTGAVAPAVLTGGYSLLPQAAKATAGTGVLSKLAQIPKLLSGDRPTIKRTAALGAGSGGLSAVGTSEKPLTEQWEEFLKGAALGGGTTLGLGAVAKYAAVPAFQYIKKSLGFGEENRMADLAIAQALAKDGFSPEQAGIMLEKIARNEMTLADVGENTRALLRRATAAPGMARMEAKGELAAREAGRVERISEDMRQLMSGSKDFYTDVQDLIKKRRTDANELYEAAFTNPPSFTPDTAPEILRLRNYPSFKKAMKKAEADLANRGLDPKDPQYALRGLHHTKLALDDMIGEAMRAGKTNEASTLIEMKNKMLADLEKASPEYKTARLAYAGDSEMLTAMERGRDVYKLPEPELRKLVNRFKDNPSEMDAFRAGIAQAMLEKVRVAGPVADPYKTLLSRDAEAKLRRAFRDDEAFDEFKNRLLSEQRMLETEKTGFRRSPADTDLEPTAGGVGAARAFLSGAPVTGTIETLRTAFPAVTGMPPRIAQPTAERLLTPTTQVQDVIEGIMGSLKSEEQNLMRQSGLAGAGAVMTGQQMGERPIKPQQPGPGMTPQMPPLAPR